MPKYKQVFQEMLAQNKDVFTAFQEIHDQYAQNPKTYQGEFNRRGEEVANLIRQYENRLCRQTEGSQFGKFSSNLAIKFQEEVRTYFPQIDNLGLEEELFELKKIHLS